MKHAGLSVTLQNPPVLDLEKFTICLTERSKADLIQPNAIHVNKNKICIKIMEIQFYLVGPTTVSALPESHSETFLAAWLGSPGGSPLFP